MKKRIYLLIIIVICISGCASTRIRHAVPVDLLNKAQLCGMQDIRALSGRANNLFIKDVVSLLDQEDGNGLFSLDGNDNIIYSALAISGGAANGAYGAGLLKGWSQTGSRPVFKVVTGISTGAIIAPFAFLGSNYDDKLEKFYTTYSTKDVMRKKGLFQILRGNSLTNNRLLERLIEQHCDKQLLKDIAIEYSKGRRLYVGTTNLDAQQLVIWDMGKIAAAGDEKASKLFRKIILASASIPVVFPPVYFDVEINNEIYDEMHVDGGITKQVFFLYDILQGLDKAARAEGMDISKIKHKIYIIKNGYVDAIWKEVQDSLSSIAERSIDTMTNAQGVGDIYQLYSFTKMRKGDFNLASIPAHYTPKAKEFFDPIEMRNLFNLGFDEASSGYNWKKAPSGVEVQD